MASYVSKTARIFTSVKKQPLPGQISNTTKAKGELPSLVVFHKNYNGAPYKHRPLLTPELTDNLSASLESTDDDDYISNMIEDEFGLYARFDMPGVGDEGVKLYQDLKNLDLLLIKGVENRLNIDDSSIIPRKYSTGIVFTPGIYMSDFIAAFVTNGVLDVCVPKINISIRSLAYLNRVIARDLHLRVKKIK